MPAIRANDFASSKVVFLKRLERLYARKQEIEENRKQKGTTENENGEKKTRARFELFDFVVSKFTNKVISEFFY